MTDTKARRKLTALDRAKEDLDAAEKRADKAATRDSTARQEASAARAEKDTADREVTAYRDLVKTLGGTPTQAPNKPTTDKEPTE